MMFRTFGAHHPYHPYDPYLYMNKTLRCSRLKRKSKDGKGRKGHEVKKFWHNKTRKEDFLLSTTIPFFKGACL